MKTLLIFILIPILLSGCSTRWMKNRDNAEIFTTADRACWAGAKQEFPVKNELAERTTYVSQYVICENRKHCDGKDYREIKLPARESYVVDVNSSSRWSSYYGCMSDNGWNKVSKWKWDWDKIPITQQHIESSI